MLVTKGCSCTRTRARRHRTRRVGRLLGRCDRASPHCGAAQRSGGDAMRRGRQSMYMMQPGHFPAMPCAAPRLDVGPQAILLRGLPALLRSAGGHELLAREHPAVCGARNGKKQGAEGGRVPTLLLQWALHRELRCGRARRGKVGLGVTAEKRRRAQKGLARGSWDGRLRRGGGRRTEAEGDHGTADNFHWQRRGRLADIAQELRHKERPERPENDLSRRRGSSRRRRSRFWGFS